METVLLFLCGAAACAVLALVFAWTKGIFGVAVRLIAGASVVAFLSLAHCLPFNALTAATVGVLGVPGLIAVYIITAFF